MEKKRISRRLSRSNSDADLLNVDDDAQTRNETSTDSLDRRRSHSIDEILLSGEEEMEMSLESASNKIEEILGNDRKFTKSGSKQIFRKGLLKRGKSEGKGKKVHRSPSHRDERNHSGTTTPTDPGSSDNSPSISRKRKAVIKKMRKSLLLNFNTTEDFETSTNLGEDTASISSGERLSTSPSNIDIDHTTNNGNCGTRIKSIR